MIEVLQFSSLRALTVVVPWILQPALQFIMPVIILPPDTIWVEVLAVLLCEWYLNKLSNLDAKDFNNNPVHNFTVTVTCIAKTIQFDEAVC